MKKYIQVKDSELPALRLSFLESQQFKDPITDLPLKFEDSVMDHKHKEYSNQPIGENDAGLIRAALSRKVNSFEGRIFNAFKRDGLDKDCNLTLPQILRRLADYIETPASNYIYPTEKPKSLLISIMQYKKLMKAYNSKYPKRNFEKNHPIPFKGKLNESFIKLLEEFNMLEDVQNNQVKDIHKIFKQSGDKRTLNYLNELNKIEREKTKR